METNGHAVGFSVVLDLGNSFTLALLDLTYMGASPSNVRVFFPSPQTPLLSSLVSLSCIIFLLFFFFFFINFIFISISLLCSPPTF